MKTATKLLVTVPVLVVFLYMAWACSTDDFFNIPNYTEVYLNNKSDSCKVKEVELIYRVRRDNNDTTVLSFVEILPGDSLFLNLEKGLDYKKMNFTCDCPGHVFSDTRNIQLDTIGVNQIVFDCD
ncbi:MAG: hypothetical protein GC192_00265 [Bacteroidetes bacterium]|nr:hypothetical protein [Bacteroidota bacterium]